MSMTGFYVLINDSCLQKGSMCSSYLFTDQIKSVLVFNQCILYNVQLGYVPVCQVNNTFVVDLC